eukprot:5257997-Prymnesium_polylepis.1
MRASAPSSLLATSTLALAPVAPLSPPLAASRRLSPPLAPLSLPSRSPLAPLSLPDAQRVT